MWVDIIPFNKKALEKQQQALDTYGENITYLSQKTQFVVDSILEGFLDNFPKEMRFQVSPVLRNYRHQIERILNTQTGIIYANLLTLAHKFPEKNSIQRKWYWNHMSRYYWKLICARLWRNFMKTF